VAITIHKSQGLTLNRVVLGIGNKELAFGITYVGCSRVKSYKGLAFHMSYPWERLEKVNQAKGMQAVRAEIARLKGLIENS
jgi:ATP-dependent exoDNAse (exonuclease V) alpha subunit